MGLFNDTVGVLGHVSIRSRLKSLKDIGIKISAEAILRLSPKDRPEELKMSRGEGFIIVDPPYTEEDLDPDKGGLLGTVSLDLELGDIFCIHSNPHSHPIQRGKSREDLIVDITQPETIRAVEEHDKLCKLAPDEYYVLAPGELVKGFTKRYFFMPYNLMGLVVGRSKVGRFGITTTVDAPKIDPGFSGRIVLELAHHGAYRFALSEGIPIAQLIFFSVEGKVTMRYDETHDTYTRNEHINYAFAPHSAFPEKIIKRIGVKPIKEE